jgi:hypothetical protein
VASPGHGDPFGPRCQQSSPTAGFYGCAITADGLTDWAYRVHEELRRRKVERYQQNVEQYQQDVERYQHDLESQLREVAAAVAKAKKNPKAWGSIPALSAPRAPTPVPAAKLNEAKAFGSAAFIKVAMGDSGAGKNSSKSAQSSSLLSALVAVAKVCHSDSPTEPQSGTECETKPEDYNPSDPKSVALAVYKELEKSLLAAIDFDDSAGPVAEPYENNLDNKYFVLDANGAAIFKDEWISRRNAGNGLVYRLGGKEPDFDPAQRVFWLLRQIAGGAKYMIACKGRAPNCTPYKMGDSGSAPSVNAGDDAVRMSLNDFVSAIPPQTKDAGNAPNTTSGRGLFDCDLPDRNCEWFPMDISALHFTGARDDMLFSTYGLSDALASSPSITVQPTTTTTNPPKNTFNTTAIGDVGYSFYQRTCEFDASCAPQSLTVLVDGYYGQDKNAPKSTSGSSAGTINRIGAGFDYAVRFNTGETLTNLLFNNQPGVAPDNGALLQLIPEFVTDTRFESKTFYGEGRVDVTGLVGIPCFGGNTVKFGVFKINCGLAVISDGAHSFKVGQQVSLYDNFARLGGQTGLVLTVDPAGCNASICKFLLDRASVNVWYKDLADVSDFHATLHNFTAKFSFSLSQTSDDSSSGAGSGLQFTVQYTDGLEDITLYKLPTWSVGLSGKL